MGKPKKDSWKKLGMDLAASVKRPEWIGMPYKCYVPSNYDMDKLVRRARALRKGANRGKA